MTPKLANSQTVGGLVIETRDRQPGEPSEEAETAKNDECQT